MEKMIQLSAGDKHALRIGTSKSHKYCQRCYLLLKAHEAQFCSDCQIIVEYWLHHRKHVYKLFYTDKGVRWFECRNGSCDKDVTATIRDYYTRNTIDT